MTRHRHAARRRRGFTLVELLVVMGLIAMLMSLLFPVAGKMRAAANSTACLSNLRQMGMAWTLYTTDNRGKLIPYAWHTPTTPEVSWNGYWPGVLEQRNVKGQALLCNAATDLSESAPNRGYGNANLAWNGKFAPLGSAVRFNPTTFRASSYGYNRYLTARGGYGQDGQATSIGSVTDTSNVPMFFDCAYIDARPVNGSEASPVDAPPDLKGSTVNHASPEHFKILLARHGRGINACMADGSTRWVPLDDLYTLSWRSDWRKYRLPNLPAH
jgi:prepilin-type N-terminal cleavage/methylation domain-containing protein/prepilin-type processing-associated H-X9-DG protein